MGRNWHRRLHRHGIFDGRMGVIATAVIALILMVHRVGSDLVDLGHQCFVLEFGHLEKIFTKKKEFGQTYTGKAKSESTPIDGLEFVLKLIHDGRRLIFGRENALLEFNYFFLEFL